MSYTEKELEKQAEIPTKGLIEKPKGESTAESIEESTVSTEGVAEATEESAEDTKKPIEPLTKNYRKFLIGGMIVLLTLLMIYFGMAQYFKNHFYFGTEINGINVSGKTPEDVKAVMAAELKSYTLYIKERGGKTEQIKGSDVGLKNSSDEELKKLKDCQTGWKWIIACFSDESTKKTIVLTFDQKLLQERINQLSCLQPGNTVEPQNPTFKYLDKGYVIVDGTIGNKVNKDILYSHIVDSIGNMQAEVDLELTGCYIRPQYDSKSPKVIAVKNMLNKYVSTKISYTFGKNKETLDGSLINHWLTVDEDYRITVDNAKVKDYINKLSSTYNTVGKTRSFITSSGTTIKIGGGDYGRAIDKAKETQFLVSAIKKGETITKEPIYRQNTLVQGNNDIGNTYVEISLAKQHLWFYKNAALIIQGDVVTGNVRQSHSTPKGVYSLKYKARNVILRGPGYAVHVDFWMPFNGGVGIHDASWRRVFGYNIYKTNGSHGCVNSPYNLAREIFNHITPGTPVICY